MTKVTTISIQQALVKELKLTYRAAAAIMRVNHRTLWQHVAARPGSKVAAWEDRTEAQRRGAIAAAQKLIG